MKVQVVEKLGDMQHGMQQRMRDGGKQAGTGVCGIPGSQRRREEVQMHSHTPQDAKTCLSQ